MNVYADNAATTKMCAAAIKGMLPYMMETGCKRADRCEAGLSA